MSYWKYEIVHDYNATQLIKEFREENLKLKKSKGTEDDETDFIMYAEKDDHTISLGRVLLVKMSDAMVNYYYQNKLLQPSFDLPNFWAEHIYEQNKNNATFQFNKNEIAAAFLESVKLQKDIIADVSVLDAENFIRKVLENVSDKFRNDEKFKRTQWDPNLGSDEYLLKQTEKPVNYLIEKCDSSITVLKELKEQLELFRDFKIIGKEIKLVERIIDINNEIINGITAFKNYLIENRNDVRKELAFLCGVWDGSVEFIAGFIDIALLAARILISDVGNDVVDKKTNLELLEVREAVEEALGAFLENPKKFFIGIIDAIKNYKHTRYDDPNLNDYQKQHNAGEDLVLTVDLVITVVTFVKGIAKLAESLPKFTKWIEEVFARGGKGARKVGNALMKLRKVAYGESELSKIAIQFRKTLPKPKHGGNIAVFEYLDDTGKLQRKEFTTIKGSRDHAEIRGIKWLEDNKIPNDKVTKIYSELEPCSLESSNCKKALQQFKKATLEYSYDYPGDGNFGAEVRRNSIKERAKDLKQLVK